jgi:hypothetical protein
MSVFAALVSSKVAVSAAALGALTVGGLGTAAYTGSLPTDAQQVAHQVIGAPAPKPVQETKDAADATAQQAKGEAGKAAGTATAAASHAAGEASAAAGSAAANAGRPASGAADTEILGLCHADAQGTLGAASAGFKTLALAAQGEANVSAFCQAHGVSASAEGAASGDSALNATVPGAPTLPAAPALPGQNSLPSAPAVPSSVPAVPTAAPALPSEATQAVRP